MFKYHKRNKKMGAKVHLQQQMMNFTPFDMRDLSYLEHLHKELKLRNTREGMVSLRKDMIESNKRSNYQNELDRITNELSRPNLPHATREHLEDKVKQMKNLVFA